MAKIQSTLKPLKVIGEQPVIEDTCLEDYEVAPSSVVPCSRSDERGRYCIRPLGHSGPHVNFSGMVKQEVCRWFCGGKSLSRDMVLAMRQAYQKGLERGVQTQNEQVNDTMKFVSRGVGSKMPLAEFMEMLRPVGSESPWERTGPVFTPIFQQVPQRQDVAQEE